MKRLQTFILAFCLLYAFTTNAQTDYQQDSIGVVEDAESYGAEEASGNNESTHTYERLYMDEYKLEELRKKKEFQYKNLDSVESKETEYVSSRTRPDTVETNTRPFNGSSLIWLVVAAAAIVIILQLAGVNMRQLFSPSKMVMRSEETAVENENIHEIPYESAIQQAIQAKNYALATRLMYLQSLKLLSDKDLIAWHENKTNWQYVFELKNDRLRNSFRTITYIFEYVRYGHMPISEEKFINVKESFSNFKMHVI